MITGVIHYVPEVHYADPGAVAEWLVGTLAALMVTFHLASCWFGWRKDGR